MIKELEITQENLHLYYNFMSDEDLIYHRFLIDDVLEKRLNQIADIINLKNNKELQLFGVEGFSNADKSKIYSLKVVFCHYLLRTVIYGIKDTLKPIDEYLEEIKNSDTFNRIETDFIK